MLFVLLLRLLQNDISISIWNIAVSDVEKNKLKLTIIFFVMPFQAERWSSPQTPSLS